jgi:hypothetical protein
MHRSIAHTAFALALVIGTGTASADRYNSPSRFGIGLELGAPTGLSGKYFLGGMMAVQGGVGVMETWGYDGWQVHAEAVFHPAYHRGRSVDIPFHVGIGGRVLEHDYYWEGEPRCWDRGVYICPDDTHLGVRAPIGVSFIFKRVPMDLFMELALTVDLIHIDDDYMYPYHDHAGLDGAFGGRFYL